MAPYTHWKQTVFYTEDVLPLYKGEGIEGHIGCCPNEKNPRDMDIVISYTHKGGHSKQPTAYTQHYFLR